MSRFIQVKDDWIELSSLHVFSFILNINSSNILSLFRTLQGHGHWVNVLALNTDYVVRTGAFDPKVTNQRRKLSLLLLISVYFLLLNKQSQKSFFNKGYIFEIDLSNS